MNNGSTLAHVSFLFLYAKAKKQQKKTENITIFHFSKLQALCVGFKDVVELEVC